MGSPQSPVPDSDTVCGLPPPLDPYEIESDAVRDPVAVGVKVTAYVQLAPEANVDVQVVV